MRIWPAILTCFALVGCTAPETTRQAAPEYSLPPMQTFSRITPTPPTSSNSIIARDFLDLAFELENGVELPVFSRFEGQITVGVNGPAPPTLLPDLDRLLGRLRREAGIRIERVKGSQPASINIVPVKRRQIQRVAPSAACFVRPNVSSWDEFKNRRNDPSTFWRQMRERKQIAIFLPNDVSPQEIRDCLNEEVAQALGPVNDLYRLNESIFNDDNFHTVLTGFDMLILRVHYDRSLQNGMSKSEVAARLPAILNRLNPGGRSRGIAAPHPNFEAWEREINTALTPGTTKSKRLRAAKRAVSMAQRAGAADTRVALSNYVLGRLSLSSNPEQALTAFLTAGRIYQNRPGTAVQEAHVALQLAAFQLSGGKASEAIRLVDQNLAVIRQAEHAALLSLLLMVKAEALELLDRPTEAEKIQQEALSWARYGFGTEAEIRDRAAEIFAISPRSRQGDSV